MNKTIALLAKTLFTLIAICVGVALAAKDLAPHTPVAVVLAYALGGAALVVLAVLVAMWIKFAMNQYLLNAGATDTQWLWFKSDPKGLEALRTKEQAKAEVKVESSDYP